jgi:hypothetical protein
MRRSSLSSPASLRPRASAISTRWTSLLHQGRIFPSVVGSGGAVAGRGIALQLADIGGGGVKFFGRPAAGAPCRDPGPELAQRRRRQAHRAPRHDGCRRPRDQIRPGDREEPQVAIGLFHAQRVTTVPCDDLELRTAERMHGQADRRRGPAREPGRPRVRRRPWLGFGSALGLSLSGASVAPRISMFTSTRSSSTASTRARARPRGHASTVGRRRPMPTS